MPKIDISEIRPTNKFKKKENKKYPYKTRRKDETRKNL